MADAGTSPNTTGPLRWLRPLLGVALFGVALYVLDRQLHEHTLAEVSQRLHAIPASTLALALALTALSYTILTGFDGLALRYICKRIPYPRVALTSFIAYVFSMDLGLSVFGSGAIRYRLYSLWGLTVVEVSAIMAFTTLTFWLGLLGVGGALLTVAPLAIPDTLHLPIDSTRPVGVLLLAGLAGYLGFSLLHRRPITIRDVPIAVPRPTMTCAQVIVAGADWMAASSVLWLLLPAAPGLEFPTFVTIFMAAQILGLASTVPAGLGVFEGVCIALLAPYLSAGAVLGPLIAFRIIYYLLPIFVAVGLLGAVEALQRRASLDRVRSFAATVGPAVVPRVLALGVLVAGLLLVLAGAAPAATWHVRTLRPIVSLPIVEISHLLSVAAGLGLVFLARGIQRRIDATWSATLALVGIGFATSLLHGAHLLLAAALAALFLSLLPCRSYFYRRTALFSATLTGEWTGLVAVGFAGAIWLGLWANGHVDYAHSLWTQWTWDGHASRTLRAGGLVFLTLASYAAWRLTRPQPALPAPASPEDLARATRIAARAPRSDAFLALLGDKGLLFDDDDGAMLMYGVSERSWVAMGDPIGRPEQRQKLAWRFRELSDQHGGWPVFYEVSAEDLPTYLDLGLSLHKLGENARVRLENFSLEGSRRKSMRHTLSRCEREGCSFEVVPPEGVAPLLGRLETISNAWLREKGTREKGFSLGAFSPDYISRLPLAVVRQNGQPVAFANLWLGGDQGEIAPDLMRYDPETAPTSVMEYLFTQLILHGKEQGFRWFGLGMAPLSGLPENRLAPLWNRMGSLLYEHGEHFYNFQGLRQYKAKFDPEWEPRYLASPGGFTLPRVLTQVSALISGGLRGVVSR
ncbi:MAG: bifunctional lysylphosphatidylglycerol flippase/synthetase MprF [bacterium]|nr:bifunctional lysylphosphatidylglycerol flippase/synthetase MprF [bacterium]